MIKFFFDKLSYFVPIKYITNNFNPVLLYHSLGVQSEFENNLDHVNLKTLEKQLIMIKKHWKFVSIDEYVESKNKKGIASITIDDGYKNVIDEALGLLINLELPITFFINSSSFDGKIFWRDKVRFLIKNNLVKKFLNNSKIFKIEDAKEFYYISKNPEYNSICVEKEIDIFLQNKNLKLNQNKNLCFDNDKYLINHPLISYGNHTSNHYLLSSLNNEEQYREILECKNFLKKKNINISKVFCLPFGGINSYNIQTQKILFELNYKNILKSNNNLDELQNSEFVERFMPKTSNILSTLKKLYLKKLFKKKLI